MAIRYLSGINVDSNTLFVDDANNRVGIGTNSPSRQLELVGADAYIQLTRSSTSTQATLGFNTGATNDWLIRTGDGSTSNLQFYSYGTSSYVMTIARSSGNVGIGTTAPSGKLDISASAGTYMLNLTNADETAFKLIAYNHGTVSAPGLAFTYGLYYNAQENTSIKFYRGGGTTGGFMAFTTNDGSEHMRITTAGNVGIGTTSPATKLDVNGGINIANGNNLTWGGAYAAGIPTIAGYNAGAGGALYFYPNGSTSGTKMFIASDGNVGIGTTSPAFKLEVNAGSNAGMWLQGTSDARYHVFSSSSQDWVGYELRSSNVNTFAGGIFRNNGANNRVSLYNKNSEAISLMDAGNVGIGTTSPSYKLDVSGDINFTSTLKFGGVNVIHGTFADIYANIRVIRNASTSVSDGMYIGYDNSGGASGHLRFFANGTNERMRIDASTGNVGIGTTSPSTKLHVFTTSNSDQELLRLTVAPADSSGAKPKAILGFYTPAEANTQDYTSGRITSKFDVAGYANSRVTIESLDSGGNFIETLTAKNGNVGIGTTSPAKILDINIPAASHANYGIRLNSAVGYGGASLYHDYGQGNGATVFKITNDYGDARINLTQDGYDASGSPSSIRFFTAPQGGGDTGLERVRIASTGNVGIGTTSPSTKLDVIGVGAFGTMTSSRGTYSNGLSLQNNTGEATSLFLWQSGVASAHIGSPANSTSLHIVNSYNTGLITDPNSIVLTNTGNVGIGTTAPGAKLEIAQNTDNTDGPTLRIANNANTLSNGQLIGAIDFYNGDDSGTGNAVGAFIRSFTADAVLPVSSQYLSFAAGGTTERMRIASTGATRLNAYGSGSFTGTVAYNLAVDSSGNIIETAGGVVDGSGTANYVSKWSDANTLTDSQLFDNGTNVGIGTTSPNAQLDAFTTQGGSTIAATHGTGGTYPKASGISFGATSTSLSVSNNGGTVVFTGGAGIYANNGAASNNPTELVFWTTSAGSPAARLTIASTGAATFTSSVTASSLIKSGGTSSQYLMADGSVSTTSNVAPRYVATVNVSQTAYTQVCTIVGGSLASAVNMSFQGTSGNVVVNVTAQILVNHFQDILITTTSGFYSQLNIRVISNNNESYSVEAQVISAQGQTTDLNIEVFPLNSESVTFGGSPLTPGTTLVHTTRSGVYVSATEPMSVSSGSDIYAAGNVGIGTTSPSGKLHVAQNNSGGVAAILLSEDESTIQGPAANTQIRMGGNLVLGGSNIMTLGTNGSERMRITSDGNLSVGTTANPGSRTNIYISESGALPNAILRLQNSGSQYLAKMILTDGNTNDAVIGYQGGVTGATQYLGFGLGTAITQMVLNGSGNVGIGTTAPQLVGAAWTTLEVQGQSAGGGGIVYTANNGATVKSHFYTDGTSGFVGTQTNHYFGFTTNNQERGRFTAGGNLLIGTTTDAGHLLYVNGTSRFNGVIHGAARLMVGITSDQTYASIFVGGDITTGGSQYALLLDPQLSGTNNYGLSANARIKASHAATNAYGVYIVNNELLSGASIVNNYGLYIANQTNGSSINYALYSAGGTSYFAGNVGIGTTAPVVKTHIVGPTLTTTSETTYPLWLSDTGDTTKALILGFDLANDVGVIQAVDQAVAWKDVCIAPTAAAVGIGNVAPSQKLHVTGNIRVTGAYYDSSNSAGSSGQVLSSTGSGTAWVNQGEATATSLYDLLPAARVAFNWTGQVVNDTWTTVFSKSSNLLTTGTWMVRMYVSDFATGGGHYTYTYSGMFTWYQDTTNQGGEQAASEIYLHRMGHAANASVLYLRTTETAAASSGDGLFQIKGNYSNTSNQTIQFQFVKIF